jgi:CHASE3 domain sensor protein
MFRSNLLSLILFLLLPVLIIIIFIYLLITKEEKERIIYERNKMIEEIESLKKKLIEKYKTERGFFSFIFIKKVCKKK